jgi:hypothetical protein
MSARSREEISEPREVEEIQEVYLSPVGGD